MDVCFLKILLIVWRQMLKYTLQRGSQFSDEVFCKGTAVILEKIFPSPVSSLYRLCCFVFLCRF